MLTVTSPIPGAEAGEIVRDSGIGADVVLAFARLAAGMPASLQQISTLGVTRDELELPLVNDIRSPDVGERSQTVRLGGVNALNMFHSHVTDKQSIGQQRTVTLPGNRFRAHHRRPVFPRHRDQAFQRFAKLRGLHVVGISAKSGFAETGVNGIGAGRAHSGEPGVMAVHDPGRTERTRHRLAIELRVVPRFRHAADVRQLLNLMPVQKFDQLFDAVVRMADGPERHVEFSVT